MAKVTKKRKLLTLSPDEVAGAVFLAALGVAALTWYVYKKSHGDPLVSDNAKSQLDTVADTAPAIFVSGAIQSAPIIIAGVIGTIAFAMATRDEEEEIRSTPFIKVRKFKV